MKELMKQLGKFLLEALQALNWKNAIYMLFKNTILPALKKRVENTASDIDDVIYNGIERMVEVFLSPSQPQVPVSGPAPIPPPTPVIAPIQAPVKKTEAK